MAEFLHIQPYQEYIINEGKGVSNSPYECTIILRTNSCHHRGDEVAETVAAASVEAAQAPKENLPRRKVPRQHEVERKDAAPPPQQCKNRHHKLSAEDSELQLIQQYR